MAIYRALNKAQIDRDYAITLVGDMQWQAVVSSKDLIPIIDPLRKKLQKLTTKDPKTYLEKRLKSI